MNAASDRNNGKDAFTAWFWRMAVEVPGKSVQAKRAIAEGDVVVLYCNQFRPDSDDHAGTDIFRFDADGRIVEHWNGLRIIPATSANANGLFWSRLART